MMWVGAGMTWVVAGVTWVVAGVTWEDAGMTGGRVPMNRTEAFSWMDFDVFGCLDLHFCGAMGGDAGQFDEINPSCTSITLRRASSRVLAKTTVPVCSRSHSGQWSLRMTY